MNRITATAALALCLTVFGCFHATIETGLAPNAQVISQKWAACWIFGLVPPKTVEAAAQCPGGVSRVETQRSFLNQLVGGLTLGIYSPMEIVVTCSDKTAMGDAVADDAELVLAMDATPEQIREAFGKAAELSSKRHAAVYVRFLESEAENLGF